MCDAIVFQHVGDMQRQHSSVCSSSASLWWEIGLNPSCSDSASSLLSSSPPPSPNYSTAFSMPSTPQPAAHPLFLCCEDLWGWEKKATECSPLCKCSFLFQMWAVTLSVIRGEVQRWKFWARYVKVAWEVQSYRMQWVLLFSQVFWLHLCKHCFGLRGDIPR